MQMVVGVNFLENKLSLYQTALKGVSRIIDPMTGV